MRSLRLSDDWIPLCGLSEMVPSARRAGPEANKEGSRTALGRMGENEKHRGNHPSLASAIPCYLQEDHQNQMGALECPECHPFPSLMSMYRGVNGTHTLTTPVICTCAGASSNWSNNSDISSVCVCVCVQYKRRLYIWNAFSFSNYTNQCMYQYIVQSNVTSKTTHNLSHIDTTTTIQTIANTIMSTKFTDDTL